MALHMAENLQGAEAQAPHSCGRPCPTFGPWPDCQDPLAFCSVATGLVRSVVLGLGQPHRAHGYLWHRATSANPLTVLHATCVCPEQARTRPVASVS